MDANEMIDSLLKAPHAGFRSGMVAMVGCANAGKSSLMNRILEEKVSIVSPVPQTTRNQIRGIFTDGDRQLVFIDTPGLHTEYGNLGKMMNATAKKSIEGSDAILYVIDGSLKPQQKDEEWMERLSHERMPLVFAVNKKDLKGRRLLSYRALWEKKFEQKNKPEWIETSALTGEGLDTLVDFLGGKVPKGPLLFPEEMLTDFPRKLMISDMVREQYFQVLRDEVPYNIAVWIEDVKEDGDTWMCMGTIYVKTNSHKGIVIGKKGRLLKRVKENASRELEEIYEKKVKMDLHVKVEKDWQKNFWILRRLGYA